MQVWKLALAVGVAVAAPQFAAAQELAAIAQLSPVVVTPLSQAASLDGGAAPGQSATAAELLRSHALDLTAYLNRATAGVYVNDIQNNPLQPDVNYRGYTASPLAGTPQGLSIYLDGVRLNQPFGDVVSWDLIPRAAVASVTLVRGSNPLFGLNTLGGALAIRSKDGRSAPRTTAQAGYGSNGRWAAEAETGGSAANGLHGYLTANHFAEDGWRAASPSNADQVFGKFGWGNGRTDLSLTAAYAVTDLNGNGLQEEALLRRDFASVYTRPDNTRNRSQLLNLAVSHRLSDTLSFAGNAFHRQLRTRTYNGDVNEAAFGENPYQPNAGQRAALAAAGFSGFPLAGESAANTPFPSWRCIADALLDGEPNETCNGLINRTALSQGEEGLSGQFTLGADAGARPNTLMVGASYVASRSRFRQSAQFGYLTADRSVVGVAGPGAFADGGAGSENAFDARVDLAGRTRTWSLFAADTLALSPRLQLTLSGRYDAVSVRNRDAVTPGGGAGSLDGDHRFARFNPAVRLSYQPNPGLAAYVTYDQGSRAPSSIELGCADPANPCRLPNAMAGDPPLQAVVTRTAEVGLRGGSGRRLSWSAALFRSDNRDDIVFVADDQAGFGYFRNVERTRRQGVELSLAAELGRVRLDGSYTYLDATYRTHEQLPGEANSSNDGPAPGFEGVIDVRPGDRIPLIPSQVFKARAQWQTTSRLSVDADMIAVGGVYARGNENNRHRPDGVYYLGPGRTDGYAVFNLGAEYQPVAGLSLFAQLNNLFDARYETAAQLGVAGFSETGAYVARPFAGPVIGGERPLRHATFYAPGAPRTVWAGLRYRFGT